MTDKTTVLVSWSGGKDAAWALHALRQRDDIAVVGLLTTITEGYERVAMQGIRVDVLQAQAAAAGLPVIEARMPQRATTRSTRTSFAGALARARDRWPGLRHVAFGDLFLADIRAYREALCARLGWTPLFPLFGSDTAALAREMIDGGLRATICCVDTQQLDASVRGPRIRCVIAGRVAAAGAIPAARTANSTPACRRGRCSRTRCRCSAGETVLRDGRFAYTDLLLA